MGSPHLEQQRKPWQQSEERGRKVAKRLAAKAERREARKEINEEMGS